MFQGSIVALVTPFNKHNLDVDYNALRELVEWHVEEGSDGILCAGTTGEGSTLEFEEWQGVVRACVEAARGRIPVIVGTGSNNTRHSVKKTEEAKRLGADGALVIVPYYNKPTPEGCLAHFSEVGKVGLPMILYHHPGRTGVKLSAKTLAEIGKLPSIVAFKDAAGDLDLALELSCLSQKPILAGDDALVIPFLSIGAVGSISVVANLIPAEWKRLLTNFQNKEGGLALEMLKSYLPLLRTLFLEVNPQGVKYALHLLGRCSPHLRLPLVEPREETKRAIESALKAIGLRRTAHSL